MGWGGQGRDVGLASVGVAWSVGTAWTGVGQVGNVVSVWTGEAWNVGSDRKDCGKGRLVSMERCGAARSVRAWLVSLEWTGRER